MLTSLPKHSPEVIALRKDIEQCIGRALQSPSDFECLIDRVWEKQHQVFSLSTIKRLWGYVGSNGQPRLSTLNTLSQFLGYADWNAYLAHLEQRSESESALFKGEGICTEDLSLNDILQVSWLPVRCTLQSTTSLCNRCDHVTGKLYTSLRFLRTDYGKRLL